MRRTATIFLLLTLAGCRSDLSDDPDVLALLPDQVDFNSHILPLLSDRCFKCHGPDANERKAGLRLDTPDSLSAVLESGSRAIVAGDLAASEVIHRIGSDDPEVLMPPPDSRLVLSEYERALIRQWIDEGAEWKAHWSLIPPELPEVPDDPSDWAASPIDAFILARLDREGMEPAEEAPRETLLRRLRFDLTGLPPTIEEIDAFLSDDSDGAYERVVDRLMASPSFGERWTWDWLDAARYADTNGFQGDPTRNMWPWRDWVVRSINANLPWDQFTLDQMAGDLLPNPREEQILATAFNRNHMYNGEGGRIPEETRVENVFDRVETMGTLFLGLTLNCARCHDHKYDAVSQREYYQFFDVFNQTSEAGTGYNGHVRPVLDLSPSADSLKVALLQEIVLQTADAVTETEKVLFPRPEGMSAAESDSARGLIGENVDALKLPPEVRSPYYLGRLIEQFGGHKPDYADQLRDLRTRISDRDRQAGSNIQVMVMDELSSPRDSYILTRGAYDARTEPVEFDVPKSLPELPTTAPRDRLGLAQWLISDEHPLMARVTVNRFWQAIFGTGIVKTADDFGVQGEAPSHPELLDWLAVDFRENGWDVKRLIKQLVMSSTYRQSSVIMPEALEKDPENRLLARGVRYRLPSWMIRDLALSASGLLVDSMGGPAVFPYQPEGVWEEATFGQKSYKQDEGNKLHRRTLYTFWRRIVGPTNLFDNAARQTCSVLPNRTNTALHALTTLNDETYVEAARVMADRLIREADSDEARVRLGFRLATGRSPGVDEVAVLVRRLGLLRGQVGSEVEAWSGVCSLLLNLDEALVRA